MAQPLLSLPHAEMRLPINSDQIRMQALERLYRRLDAVDELIRVLEEYEQNGARTPAPCIPINAVRKCS